MQNTASGSGTVQVVDVAVVGGGAAGLSAALMLGRARRSVTVIDAGRPRNRLAPHMHGLLTRDGMSPLEFLDRGRREASEYGVEFVEQEVRVIDRVAEGFLVRGAVDVLARRVVIATGLVDHLPGVEGLDALWGTGAVGCPYCDGWEVRGQALGVIATSPMSRNQAQLLRQWTSDLTVFGAAEAGIAEGELIGFDARGITLAPPAVSVQGELGDVTVTTTEASHNVARVRRGSAASVWRVVGDARMRLHRDARGTHG